MNSLWVIIGIVATVFFGLISLFAWILPRKAKLHPKDKVIDHLKGKIETIEKQVKEANENIKLIEKNLGIQIYADGLPSADPSVFDPFAKGLKLMTEYKWDEAIAEFREAIKEAKASQLVALYSLIGYCYHLPGKSDLAVENYNKSLNLAREFQDKKGESIALDKLGLVFQDKGDTNKALKYQEYALKIVREIGVKEGESAVLNNIGVIFENRGNLDKALKCLEDALKISREIGYKIGEAAALGNLGEIYRARRDLDNALKYYENALRINREIGNKEAEASNLNNFGIVFRTKGEKEKALRYYEDALRIFTQIGAQREIEEVKKNIKRLKGK
jgi:tetratricopeptide (TPR) repeat protein